MERMYPLRRSAFVHLMGLVGAFPAWQTSRDLVQRLIGRLHPVAGGHELIRLGPEADGGYVLPDDLAGIEACFSPGVLHKGGLAIPPVMEFTFHRRDRLVNPVPRSDFPCQLDRDNRPHATVPLPACWYRGG